MNQFGNNQGVQYNQGYNQEPLLGGGNGNFAEGDDNDEIPNLLKPEEF